MLPLVVTCFPQIQNMFRFLCVVMISIWFACFWHESCSADTPAPVLFLRLQTYSACFTSQYSSSSGIQSFVYDPLLFELKLPEFGPRVIKGSRTQAAQSTNIPGNVPDQLASQASLRRYNCSNSGIQSFVCEPLFSESNYSRHLSVCGWFLSTPSNGPWRFWIYVKIILIQTAAVHCDRRLTNDNLWQRVTGPRSGRTTNVLHFALLRKVLRTILRPAASKPVQVDISRHSSPKPYRDWTFDVLVELKHTELGLRVTEFDFSKYSFSKPYRGWSFDVFLFEAVQRLIVRSIHLRDLTGVDLSKLCFEYKHTALALRVIMFGRGPPILCAGYPLRNLTEVDASMHVSKRYRTLRFCVLFEY